MTIPPNCGFSVPDFTCEESGDHFCEARATHVMAFFEKLLKHTKGSYARKPFVPANWQRDDIIRPLFGTVVWDSERETYKRQYEIAWIELARKNGKSESLAAIMLYLLVGDGEESAEVYGVARDKEQASLCFDVAAQMVRFSPVLSKRLKITPHIKRIFDEKTHSFYQVVASDAAGALGSNPSGVAADEILAWRDGGMWEALRTGMGSGARKQPLMVAATTAGNDSSGFAGRQHAEMQRIADDPSRAPHIFVYMRNTPKEADPWDEKNWYFANPALGDFLSLEGMRRQALEAKNDPTAENGFRQFKLNQWTSQTHRWMPMHLYDDSAGHVFLQPEMAREHFAGRDCWAGMDLASRQDFTAWCLVFPDADNGLDALWRFWLPEAAFYELDKKNDGMLGPWVQAGWLTLTEGDVLEYDQLYSDVAEDAAMFNILGGDADSWSAAPVIQEIEKRARIEEIFTYKNNFDHMSPSMRALFDLVKEQKFRHHGNPVARWHFDSVEARVAPYDPDAIRPDKPNRQQEIKRIDGVPAAIMAVNAWMTRGFTENSSVYEKEELFVL